VTAASEDKTPEQIEQDMAGTREAITEKVSALETQVLGTVQAVTGTVEAVKDAITAAPTAVSDTVRQTAAAVKDSLRDTVKAVTDTVRNFSVRECVRRNPWAAVGASAAGGFLAGFFLGGSSLGLGRRSIMARGHEEPASGGRPGTADEPGAGRDVPRPSTPYRAADTESTGSGGHGLLGDLFGTVGRHVREIAEQAISTAMAAVKRNVGTAVPQVVDHAVQQVTERVTGPAGDTSRVDGPSYSARG